MRYERKVLALSISLGALLVIWALGGVFSPERSVARSESTSLATGKIADAASIELTSPGAATIDLAKSGDSWTLVDGSARLPVQSSRVKTLLDAVEKPGRLKVVGRSKAAWADFGLEDGASKRAVIKDSGGAVIADIRVGAYSSAGSDVYLRSGDSERSYAVDSSISAYVGYGRSVWLDLKVLGGAVVADVQSVSLKSSIALDGAGKPPLSLGWTARREGQGWKIGSAEADAQALESLIRSATALSGEDIVASPPDDAFASVSARVELEFSSGVSKVLEVGAPAGDNRFYLRAAGNPLVYLVSDYSLRSILKESSSLAKKQ